MFAMMGKGNFVEQFPLDLVYLIGVTLMSKICLWFIIKKGCLWSKI